MINKPDLEIQMRLLRCWGKTDPYSTDPSVFHPALYHMLDIGYVAQTLLSGKTSTRWKNVFSSLYDVDPASLVSFLPFIISLHDIGKISASFQRMNEPQHIRLLAEGFSFGRSKDISHPEVSRNFISYEWPDQAGIIVSERSQKMIREMVGMDRIAATNYRLYAEFSPHTWGWTGMVDPVERKKAVFPTHVGMDRKEKTVFPFNKHFPLSHNLF